MKFKCSWTFTDCHYEQENDDEERLLAEAEEHYKSSHPGEALERDRARSMMRMMGPIR